MNVEDVINIDVFKESVTKDINNLKNEQAQFNSTLKALEKDVAKLTMNDKLQDEKISDLKETLSEIKEGIVWIQRKITGAMVTAIVVALIGGVIGIAVTKVFQ